MQTLVEMLFLNNRDTQWNTQCSINHITVNIYENNLTSFHCVISLQFVLFLSKQYSEAMQWMALYMHCLANEFYQIYVSPKMNCFWFAFISSISSLSGLQILSE